MYRLKMFGLPTGTWLVIGDSQDPVWRWSAINATNSTGVGGRIPRGPLSMLQEGLNRMAGSSIPPLKMPHSVSCIISYLEQQVLTSKALGSSQEYVHWIMAFVSFLCTHGTVSELVLTEF
jgi:protein HIRA/HIR1